MRTTSPPACGTQQGEALSYGILVGLSQGFEYRALGLASHNRRLAQILAWPILQPVMFAKSARGQKVRICVCLSFLRVSPRIRVPFWYP